MPGRSSSVGIARSDVSCTCGSGCDFHLGGLRPVYVVTKMTSKLKAVPSIGQANYDCEFVSSLEDVEGESRASSSRHV
jgi:hypothetical protein